MNQPRWAKRLAAATVTHLRTVQAAKADGVIDRNESRLIEASAEDMRIYAGIVDAGDVLAQASQRASDPDYLAEKLAHYEAWAALAPSAA